MKLYYYKAKHGNFGDDLNAWLWSELLPDVWDEGRDGITFVGVGTILNRLVPDTRMKIVLGSGVGYAPLPAGLHDGSWEMLAVRGPLSARAAGLSEDRAVTDGALLLSAVPALTAPPKETRGIIFVPHVSAAGTGPWEEICNELGIAYVDPRWESRRVIDEIRSARLVLADAMHAAIIADTFRVPFVPLVSSREISTFKWTDWTLGMGLPYEPMRLPASSLAEAVRDRFVGPMGLEYLSPWLFARGSAAMGADAPDRLIADLDETARRQQDPRQVWINKNSRRVWERLARPASALAARTALKGVDARLKDRTRAVLEKAKRAPGFLSDDAVHATKREQLLERLDVVRRIVRGAAPAAAA